MKRVIHFCQENWPLMIISAIVLSMAIPLCMIAHLIGDAPARRERAEAQTRESRATYALKLAKTPVKIDVRGLSLEQMKERYGYDAATSTIDQHPYVLTDNALMRVDSTW